MASILYVIRIFEVASAWRINSSSAFLGGLRKIAPAVNVLKELKKFVLISQF